MPFPQSAGPLVQPEADLQRDLEAEAAVVLDPAARVGDLEPVEVVQVFEARPIAPLMASSMLSVEEPTISLIE